MDKFLDIYDWPTSNQEYISIFKEWQNNRHEAVIKSLPTKKSQEPDKFPAEFDKTFKDTHTKPALPW